MACACKVNQEIERINRYYGYRKKDDGNRKMSINKKDAAITIFIYLLMLPLIPLMFLTVIGVSVFSKDGKISMGKFLGFIHTVRNGRKEQII